MKITYYIIGGIWWLLSLLPLKILYLFSDMLYVLVHHVIGYRKKIVRKNLTNSFPEKSLDEIKQIEKGFYHFFCDYIVETIKQFSISKEEMKKRMVISGVEEMKDRMEKENKTFCFIYLGHFCNWEWIASLPYWVPNDILCAQIYHPLYNKAFDKLFLRIRNKFGGECIPMKETLRRIIELRRAKQKTIIGFISDQAPKWNSIHHFVDFLNQETPVFIGTEKIAKQCASVGRNDIPASQLLALESQSLETHERGMVKKKGGIFILIPASYFKHPSNTFSTNSGVILR